MKTELIQSSKPNPLTRLMSAIMMTALMAIVSSPARAHDGDERASRYRQTNLVSDLPDIAALQDPNLINAWGISFPPAGPFWVSANGTGRSVIYAVTNDAHGHPTVTKQGLEVTIPG